jgi:RNA polymerase sigma-70 factor (ECF subfamily)
VVRNVERSKRRYRAAISRLPLPSDRDDHPDLAEGVAERLDREARDARVRTAFVRLSKSDQDVITLCVLEELTQTQAAEVLGVPLGTVKSRLSRAKKRLAQEAGELLQGFGAGAPAGSAAEAPGGAE